MHETLCLIRCLVAILESLNEVNFGNNLALFALKIMFFSFISSHVPKNKCFWSTAIKNTRVVSDNFVEKFCTVNNFLISENNSVVF